MQGADNIKLVTEEFMVPAVDPVIRVPTLVIVAKWDADTPPAMSLGYFERLTAAPCKRLVIVGEGTHPVLMEKKPHPAIPRGAALSRRTRAGGRETLATRSNSCLQIK